MGKTITIVVLIILVIFLLWHEAKLDDDWRNTAVSAGANGTIISAHGNGSILGRMFPS